MAKEKSKKILHEELRQEYVTKLIELLCNSEEVLRVGSNEIAIPVVDSDGNDEFVTFTVKVPTGSREDGEAYDGYAEAEEYRLKCAEKKAKAEANAEKKAKKIEADKLKREQKAKERAERGGK